jgi:hypothetical protein
MKWLSLLCILFSFSVISQETTEATFVSETKLKVDAIVGIDNFGDFYFIDKSVFKLKSDRKKIGDITYNNLQLGELSSANVFNPLKINLFYKDFNTVIILDNRLAEIFKIDFNTTQPYKNISHIATGNDNTLWVFNQDTQQLEIYDYLNQKTRARAMPISSQVLDLKSNFNFCWLLTENNLYSYNYFGSMVLKIKNEGYTALSESNGRVVLQKENSLYLLKKGSDQIEKIEMPELLIKQFLLTNESLYIYVDETLQKFQLKIK